MKSPFPIDADYYLLFEARSGSNVGEAANLHELHTLLDELVSESLEDYVAVIPLDSKGQRIGSWSAIDVLADA